MNAYILFMTFLPRLSSSLCSPSSCSTTGHCREPPLFSSASFSQFLQGAPCLLLLFLVPLPPTKHQWRPPPPRTARPWSSANSSWPSLSWPLLEGLLPVLLGFFHVYFFHQAWLGGSPLLLSLFLCFLYLRRVLWDLLWFLSANHWAFCLRCSVSTQWIEG